jgi:outer membrane murein-binding lipoprotein Lpp
MPAYSAQRPDQYYERDVITDWPRGPRGPRPSAVKNDEFTRKKQSRGRRMVRAVARLFIAVLIGVGATLAWQSHGDQAKETVRTWAPSLSWLLPISTKLPRDDQASTAAIVTSTELVQQLKPVILNLATVRQGVDQLATTIKQLTAQQEKMAQDIALLQAIEHDIREKLSTLLQPRPVAQRKTPQSTGQSSTIQPSSVSPEPSTSGPPLRLLDGPAQSAR